MTVVIGAKITTDATALQRDLKRDAKIIESSLGGAFKAVDTLAQLPFRTVGKLASSLGSVVGKLTSVNNLVRGAAVGVLGSKVLQVIDRTITQTGALEIQQRALAGQLNITTKEAGRYIAQVNNASKGLLDFKKSADIAAQAELFGIPREAVPQLIRFASAIAVAKGEAENAIPFIEQLLKGTSGRFGFDELRRVGVDIDERDVAGLDAQAKTAFIVAESLRQLEATSRKLGVTGRELFFTYTGIFGNLQDIRVELGKSVTQSERVQKAVKYINDLTAGIAQNLRNNGFEKTIVPLFEKLTQLAGALAADLGEAIAIGIARGIQLGAGQIGVSLSELLGKERAEAFGRFADRPIGFDRSQQRLRELGEAFGPQDDATRPGSRGRERQVRDDLRRLKEIDYRLERGRILSPQQEREIRQLDPELQQRKREEARRELEQERERIQQRTRGGVGRAANDLRRIESELEAGRLGRFIPEARRQLLDEGGEGASLSGRGRDIQERARQIAEQRREDLLRQTGLADLRPASEKVSETTGTRPAGEPGGDSPFVRLGKSFASGITGNTELSAWIDERFRAGGDALGERVTGALGDHDWSGAGTVISERLVSALAGYDWIGIGTNVGEAIGEAFLNLLPPWLRRWLQARADAEAEAENINRLNQRSDQDLGSRVRELGDAERARVQRFITEGNKRNAELPQSEVDLVNYSNELNRLIPTLIESEPVEAPAWLQNIGDSINRFFGHEEPARGINRISDAMDQTGATNIADAVVRRMADAPTVSNTNLVPRDGEGPEMSVRSAQEMLEALRKMGFTLRDGAGVAQDIDRELQKGLAKIQ